MRDPKGGCGLMDLGAVLAVLLKVAVAVALGSVALIAAVLLFVGCQTRTRYSGVVVLEDN